MQRRPSYDAAGLARSLAVFTAASGGQRQSIENHRRRPLLANWRSSDPNLQFAQGRPWPRSRTGVRCGRRCPGGPDQAGAIRCPRTLPCPGNDCDKGQLMVCAGGELQGVGGRQALKAASPNECSNCPQPTANRSCPVAQHQPAVLTPLQGSQPLLKEARDCQGKRNAAVR